MARYLMKYIAVALSALVLYGCGDKKEAASGAGAPVPVNTYVVQPERATYHDLFPGTVVAMMQVDIRAEAEGYVTGIFFKEGERVTKGQKLYTIDDRKYQATHNQALANVQVAEANLEQAKKDADRYNYLNEHDAVAKQTLDHAMTTLKNAKQQVNATKQELARTQTDLNYAVITAPFDGTIGISMVKLGNSVTRGQTVLNTISTTDPVAVDFAVNEKQISRFITLQRKNAALADSVFTLVTPDNSIYDQPGRIHIVDRAVNPQTGTLTIRLVFPNAAAGLRPGMSCMVRVRNDDTSRQILIPSKAITEQMGEYFVYVARDTVLAADEKDGAGGQQKAAVCARQIKVQQGQTLADRVIIKAGLQSGDKVIVDGVQKLHDGSMVTEGEANTKK